VGGITDITFQPAEWAMRAEIKYKMSCSVADEVEIEQIMYSMKKASETTPWVRQFDGKN
jgi:hypothetical protein